MTDDDRKPDPTVKQLLESRAPLEEVVDAATAAELQRWFGLPSFESLPPEAKPEDPEMIEARERRANAIAAVLPDFLERLYARIEPPPDLLGFTATIEISVPDIAMFDDTMVDRTVPEPREVEVSEDLVDDLHEVTPQALLRDLHRPESYFDKQFEIVDYAAEGRIEIARVVAELMATRWKITRFDKTAWQEGRGVVDDIRAARKTRWDVMFNAANLPNREAGR